MRFILKKKDEILNKIFDEESGIDHRVLIGHSGPVFSVCFSPDKYYILSGSDDGTSKFISFSGKMFHQFNSIEFYSSSPLVFVHVFVFGQLQRTQRSCLGR